VRYVALEAINEIRKAEEEAELLIKNAQEESREIIKQGNLKAEMSYEEIIKSAKSQSDNYFKIRQRRDRRIIKCISGKVTRSSKISG